MRIFYSKRFFICLCLILLPVACTGCSTTFLSGKGQDKESMGVLIIGRLISRAYEAARKQISINNAAKMLSPDYLDERLSDGKLTVALGIGTEDLGKIILPEQKKELVSSGEYMLRGKKILVEAMLVLTRDDFSKALAEYEIVFVTSHSRFGAGPVFLNDGKENPFRMQQTKGYDIIMPQSEVSGYQGTVKKTYKGPLKRKSYVVFEPDSTDLDRALPFPGYQMLVLSTCSSKKHFLDEIRYFRNKYPTTAIFTTRASCMDTKQRIFMRFLYEIFQGNSIASVVEGMNEEYTAVAWENVKKEFLHGE